MGAGNLVTSPFADRAGCGRHAGALRDRLLSLPTLLSRIHALCQHANRASNHRVDQQKPGRLRTGRTVPEHADRALAAAILGKDLSI